MSRGFIVVAGLLSMHCFSAPPDVAFDAGPPDAEQIDASITSCAPSTIVCDDASSTYVECDATGTPTFTMHCPLGCSTTSAKCVDVDPSNGLATYLDMARDDGATVAFSGSSTIDTTTGDVFNGATSINVPSAPVNGMRVFRFKSLSIAGTLRASGSATLAIVVDGDVTITGTLDVSSDRGGTAGPGADPTLAATTSTYPAGAGGGGNHVAGGAGGNSNNGTVGSAGGPSQTDPDLVPLRPGMTGGAAAGAVSPGTLPGGPGGGGVQIVSRTRIALQMNGIIDASGAGGSTSTSLSGGGAGGGAGGNVLLEAPQVVFDGSGVVISTKGGGGASAGGNGCTGCQGTDGGTNASAASGGTGAVAGGSGGTSTAAPTSGAGGSTFSAAGGGGSVGEARFNTSAGAVNPQNGAAIRSYFSNGLLATREVP